MKKFTLPNIFIFVGILLLLSGLSGANESYPMVGGFNLLLGAFAIKARNKQMEMRSSRLSTIEIVLILIFLLTVIPGVLNGAWYDSPISFCIIPIAVIVGYSYAWRKDVKIENKE